MTVATANIQSRILVIIPARGGSKGIPRKNLRPLNGKPLLYYSIATALKSAYQPEVFVSSEDSEILFFAERLGARSHQRDKRLSEDATTLDPVIYAAFKEIQETTGTKYDLIVTLQPTSPLLSHHSLDAAIRQMLENPSTDTIISAINDTHLTWKEDKGIYSPNYAARVNRQYLPQVYKETGGFLITRGNIISEKGRIGQNVSLYLVPQSESTDIDSFEDWQLCEFYLKRKTILFVVSGYNDIGLGHVYNCLILANEILNHRVVFLTDKKSDLAFEKIRSSNYQVYSQTHDNLTDDIIAIGPDLVINDILDTNEKYIQTLKTEGYKVLNIEDLGTGAAKADAVVNAIYPEKEKLPNHYFGPGYFCARDEFLMTAPIKIKKNVTDVLVTFGGVDPNNLTLKVLQSIYSYCQNKKIRIHVVTGLGYKHFDTLSAFSDIRLHRDIKNISDLMRNADLAFSSAGRTIYELALLGLPAIILAQNERELTHFFAGKQYGFEHLGLGAEAAESEILRTFKDVVDDQDARQRMNEAMLKNEIKNGKKNVINIIKTLVENE